MKTAVFNRKLIKLPLTSRASSVWSFRLEILSSPSELLPELLIGGLIELLLS